jgi:hypothetical protein
MADMRIFAYRKTNQMNLIKQFPDISGRIRAKAKRANKPVNANRQLPYREDAAVVAYYEGEFRRWHLKLFLIVPACMAIVYFALLNSVGIMNLFNV